MSDKSEKSKESLGDIISDLAQSVGEAVVEVIETIEHGVEALLKPEDTKETKNTDEKSETSKNETTETEKTNDATVAAETRVGYVSLPQTEEPIEEGAAETEVDAKTEVEAAIAKARETSDESTEKDELVAESLPQLPRTNSARLYLQSPNRIFIYWSLTGNPFETLQKAFGARAGNYQLVTKLINLQTKTESFAPAEFNGNWWYNVRSNTEYRVDLGFYAINRPFIRLLSSNTVTTPRAAPSPRADTAADWIVSTRQFITVLNASGYSHDVFGVAFNADAETGEASPDASTLAVANRFAPVVDGELNLSELRWLLVSLAAGASFADLQESLSPATLRWLEQVLAENPNALAAENVRGVFEAIFGSEFLEVFTSENIAFWHRLAPVAVGASAINFPEILFPELRFPELRAAINPQGENFGADAFSAEAFPSSAEFIN